MKFIVNVIIAAIATFSLLLPTAYAASNQDINQPATLIAPEPDAKIGIYAKPGVAQSRLGDGQGGDRVTVLEQVGSNQGDTWDHVRFDQASNSVAEGWIRSDYLSLQSSSNGSDSPTIQGNPQTMQNKTQSYQNAGQSQSYPDTQKNYQGTQGTQKSQQQPSYSKKQSAADMLSSLQKKMSNLFKKP